MSAVAYFAKIVDDTVPQDQIIEYIEAFPEWLQTDVACIILYKKILDGKCYLDSLLNKVAGIDFKNAPEVFVICPWGKGDGKINCVTCKNTRVCQECNGTGERQRKLLEKMNLYIKRFRVPPYVSIAMADHAGTAGEQPAWRLPICRKRSMNRLLQYV